MLEHWNEDLCKAKIVNEKGEVVKACPGYQCLRLMIKNDQIKIGDDQHFVGPCEEDDIDVTTRTSFL